MWLAIGLLVATVNPTRRRAELAANRSAVMAGAALTLAALCAVGWGSDGLIDALDISGPTLQVAVGLILGVRGLMDLVRAMPEPVATAEGREAPVVPVFFPILFRPELVLAAMSVSVDGGLGAMTLGAAVGLGLVALPIADRWSRSLNVVAATVLVVLAIDRLIDGVFAL